LLLPCPITLGKVTNAVLNYHPVKILTAIFSREANPDHDSLVSYLLRNHDNEDGLCLDFYTEAVARIDEDETIAPLFTEAMVIMSERVARMTMNDDYKPYINVRLGSCH
jgi:hypothetical protein